MNKELMYVNRPTLLGKAQATCGFFLNIMNAKMRWLTTWFLSMTVAALPVTGTLCAGDAKGIIEQMILIIGNIGIAIGALMAVGGILMLILAYKDDNADQQARAIRLIVIAAVLMGLPTLIKNFNLLDSINF